MELPDIVRWLTPGWDDARRAYWLRMLHAGGAFAILLVFVVSARPVRQAILALMVVISAIQVYYGGCPITRIEKRMEPERNLTVVDPVLIGFGLPRKKWARQAVTLGLSSIFIVIMLRWL